MSDHTRDTALALCPHEIRGAYALIYAAKDSMLELSRININDRPGMTDEVGKIEAYLSKASDMVREMKERMGVRE